uniref:Integrase catalytic domain-containing protein n=1 Tax=Nicotiana tabacum TaxID=4097 RepID=A0A1S4ASX6_TOBAC|nr:PREDICTED: uncharacterized protein LOC107801087 [Nicotiana tabacum]
MVDGTSSKDKFPDAMGNHWERVNAIVLSWLMNSMAKGLLGGIMYASSAQTVWEDLAERFNKVDGSRTLNLHKEIATLTQGSASVSVYFSKLKDLWEEFEALVPAPECDCPKSRDFVNYLQKLRLYQFLMGLNESYSQARSQILIKISLSTVNQAYALIVSDESQKSVAANSGIVGANPVGNFEVAMYTRHGAGGQGQSLLDTLKSSDKKKRGYNAAHNVKFLNENVDNQNQNSNTLTVAYGKNTSGLKQSACGSQVSYGQGLEEVATQLRNFTFSKDQYDQIVQLLNKGVASTSINNEDSAANTTGTDTNTTLLISNGSQDWIIDTGATNHMVSDTSLLSESTIIQTVNPKKVLLPNEDVSLVTHTGAISISDKSTIPNVFHDLFTGKVREIGKEVRGLYILLARLARNRQKAEYIARGLTAEEFSKVIKVIRTDNGTGFVNSLCEQLFKNLGMIHQKTCAYTPQQNGVAERKHRHVLEITRAIRLQANIPIKFWGHCILAAVYILNRLPSSVIANKSPYKRLYNRKPSLKHLRLLGCLCFAKVVQEQDKLMSRSRVSVHMGYSEVHKGYVLYDLGSKSFFINRDVIFKENIFPFKRAESSSTSIFLDTTTNVESYMHNSDAFLEQRFNTLTDTRNSRNSTTANDSVAENYNSESVQDFQNHNTTEEDIQTYQNYHSTTEGESQAQQNCQSLSTAAPHNRNQVISNELTTRKSTRDKQPPVWLKDFVSLNIHQERKYTLELIAEVGLTAAKPSTTPIDINTKLTTKQYDEHISNDGRIFEDPTVDQTAYQRLIGKLLYLTVTRLDIIYGVQTLSQFLQQLKKSHMEVALRIVNM